MYEGSHECTKCSNPASVHFGCVYMTTNVWQGIKLCLVSWAIVCPSPFSAGPKSSFLCKFGWRGLPHQQQSSTNQRDLLSGERIRCPVVRVAGLTTPQHGHLGSYRDGLGFHLPPKCVLLVRLQWGLETPDGRSLRSLTLPGCVDRSMKWRWGPRGC